MTSHQIRALSALVLSEISWAVLLVTSRFAVADLDLDPFLFSTLQLFAGGIVLTILSRQPVNWRDFLLDKYTLIYGLARVGTGAFFTAALVHVVASSASMLGIFNVTVGILIAIALHRKLPGRRELVGHLLIAAGFLALCLHLEGGFRNPAVIYMLASEVCVVVSTLAAEKHPQNQGDNSARRAYLTGVLLTVSGFLTVLVTLGLHATSVAVFGMGPGNDPSVLLSHLFRPDIWIAGALFGIFLRGPVVYFSLRAIQQAGGQSYLAFSAFLPFLSLGLERAAAAIGFDSGIQTTSVQVMIGLVMVIGSLWVLACQQNWPIADWIARGARAKS
nr:EamA family transporter [uncultured Roseibium sp.]